MMLNPVRALRISFAVLVLLGAWDVYSPAQAQDFQFAVQCPKVLICSDHAGLYFLLPTGVAVDELAAAMESDQPPKELVFIDTTGERHSLQLAHPAPVQCESHCVSQIM